MKLPKQLVVGLLFLVGGGSDDEKALKTEDQGVKNKVAKTLNEEGKYSKAAQLDEQLKR